MNEYYSIKDKLLSFIKPNCIHKELNHYEKTRIYDYEKEYENVFEEYDEDDIVWQNCYYDHEEEKEVSLYSGILYELEDNESVTVRLFSKIYDGEYDTMSKKYSTFDITTNTRIFTQDGPINIREFSFDNETVLTSLFGT